MKPDYILFTDGSSIPEKDNIIRYGAYAFLVINNENATYTKQSDIIGSCDSAHAEMVAITRGLEYIDSLIKKGHKSVLVLTDSKYSISFIETTLLRWYKGLSVKSKSLDRIGKNLDLYEPLARIVAGDKLDVSFVHVKSHLSYRNTGTIKTLLAGVGFNISHGTAKLIISFNRMVDALAKDKSKGLAKESGHYDDSCWIRLIERKMKND